MPSSSVAGMLHGWCRWYVVKMAPLATKTPFPKGRPHSRQQETSEEELDFVGLLSPWRCGGGFGQVP